MRRPSSSAPRSRASAELPAAASGSDPIVNEWDLDAQIRLPVCGVSGLCASDAPRKRSSDRTPLLVHAVEGLCGTHQEARDEWVIRDVTGFAEIPITAGAFAGIERVLLVRAQTPTSSRSHPTAVLHRPWSREAGAERPRKWRTRLLLGIGTRTKGGTSEDEGSRTCTTSECWPDISRTTNCVHAFLGQVAPRHGFQAVLCIRRA